MHVPVGFQTGMTSPHWASVQGHVTAQHDWLGVPWPTKTNSTTAYIGCGHDRPNHWPASVHVAHITDRKVWREIKIGGAMGRKVNGMEVLIWMIKWRERRVGLSQTLTKCPPPNTRSLVIAGVPFPGPGTALASSVRSTNGCRWMKTSRTPAAGLPHRRISVFLLSLFTARSFTFSFFQYIYIYYRIYIFLDFLFLFYFFLIYKFYYWIYS